MLNFDGNRVEECHFNNHNIIFNDNFQVTWFATDPFVLIQCVKTDVLERYRLSTLKTILTSGSIFPKEHQEALRKKLPHILINNGYGELSNSIFFKLQLFDLFLLIRLVSELVTLKFIYN